MFKYAVILISLIFTSLISAQLFAEPVLQGLWVLNETESDSLKNKLSAPKNKRKMGSGQGTGFEGRKGGYGKGRGSSKNGERAQTQAFGPFQQTLSAETLQIDGYKEVVLTFDGNLTRVLVPNPYGRVFSASGNEMIEDEFGRALSYWDSESLVVETMMLLGGTAVERYRFSAESSQLIISVSIRTRKGDSLEIRRVYERSEG